MKGNISNIEDHPKYNGDTDAVRGKPLSDLDMNGLLLFTKMGGTNLTAFWQIIEPDGTKKGLSHVFHDPSYSGA
jgi:hypothetical protein